MLINVIIIGGTLIRSFVPLFISYSIFKREFISLAACWPILKYFSYQKEISYANAFTFFAFKLYDELYMPPYVCMYKFTYACIDINNFLITHSFKWYRQQAADQLGKQVSKQPITTTWESQANWLATLCAHACVVVFTEIHHLLLFFFLVFFVTFHLRLQ